MEKDLISVIVPVYNLERYLRESIDSIINQSYKNLEIILVDDGSTDRSLEILKEYEKKDSRVIVLTQRNQGISIAMRNGLLISSGDYIARCDGDDINNPFRYELQLKYLKEHGYDLIGCYLKSFGDGSEDYKRAMEGLNEEIRTKGEQFLRIYRNMCINGGALFGRREAYISTMPFHKEYGTIEDRYIYLNFHKAGYRIGNMPETMYYYRVHHKNTSLNPMNMEKMFRNNLEIMFKYLYVDMINHARDIVIVNQRELLYIIEEVLRKNFKNLNLHLIGEGDLNSFMNEGVHVLDPKDTLVFTGILFFESMMGPLKNLGYTHLENYFRII